MIYSLRWQLLLSLVLVILVTVGMTAFFASRAASAEIERLQGRDDTARAERLRTLLARQYTESRGWLGAQRVLEQAGELYGQRVVFMNMDGLVLADSHKLLLNRHLDSTVPSQARVPLLGPEGRLGLLLVSPDLPSEASTSLGTDQDSGPSLNLLLTLSGLLAVGVAIILTFFLSRRILAPVESLSKVAQLVGGRDFSARAEVKSRDEVGELTRTFNSMAEELSRVEELRRNLVADVAHELRTPITNIRGYIEGITDGVIQADTTTLASMQGEVLLLSRLIEDLQDLALAESGRMTLQIQPCDLGDLARHAATSVQQKANTKQVELEIAAPSALPLQGDPERISQVLRNLLVNAVTYTPSGGKVRVEASQQDSQTQVLVQDTGPGVPAEDLPYIFERFYRVDKSRSRATGGVGLGLTIARRLVEAHSGSIEAFSQVGKGTQFVVTLPRNGGG